MGTMGIMGTMDPIIPSEVDTAALKLAKKDRCSVHRLAGLQEKYKWWYGQSVSGAAAMGLTLLCHEAEKLKNQCSPE